MVDVVNKRLGAVEIENGTPSCMEAVRDLTINVYDIVGDCTEEFEAFESGDKCIYVPRAYGLSKGIMAAYEEGKPMSGVEMAPVQLWDYQVPFVRQICDTLKVTPDLRIEAATGKGKTVMALEVARRLGRRTLVVVDQEFLRDQWIDCACDSNLFDMDIEDIGIVQGSVVDWEGKSIVVCMIQTMYAKEMPDEFYQNFGTVILDEAHTFGAPKFSQILLRLPQRYRLAPSATAKRTDALDKVLEYNLGKVALKLGHKHKKSKARFITYDGNCYSYYANDSRMLGRYLAEISGDGARNRLIVSAIVALYNQNRDILAVSDRLEHLSCLRTMLVLSGIPDDDVGIVAGRKLVWKYAKCLQPKRLPSHYVRGTEYTPVMLTQVRKKYTKAELEHHKETKKVVLATYKMFEKGVDVPRLSAGIDCTPRAKAEQLHGRILRSLEGKKVPIWVTIRDIKSSRAEYQFSKRLTEYVKSNAEVSEWDIHKGVRKVDVKVLQGRLGKEVPMLKLGKTITKPDGNYTVVMPNIERR